MRTKIKLIYLFISVSILLLSSLSCVAQPAQQNKQLSSQPEVVNKREKAVTSITIDGTIHPTRTAPTIDSDNNAIELALNFNKMPNVILKLNQKLVVIPDWKLGEEDWWVSSNRPKILSLDPSIDYTKPPKTGWVWIPHLVGKTNITIIEPPLACHKEPPFCGIASQAISFQVEVVDTP